MNTLQLRSCSQNLQILCMLHVKLGKASVKCTGALFIAESINVDEINKSTQIHLIYNTILFTVIYKKLHCEYATAE